MPERVHLRGTARRHWHTAGTVSATGWGYLIDGPVLGGKDLAAALDAAGPEFRSQVANLGGDFAAVRVEPTAIEVAVDRIRSMPLFYGRRPGGGWLVSDDALHVAVAIGARVDDPLAAAELMLTGATVGSSTLAPPLRQVQSGEVMSLTPDGGRSDRYFRFAHGAPLNGDEDELRAHGAAVLREAFDRMLDSVRGRPLAVPLSGGRDSRLIASLLVAAGRTDAVAFSYGRPGNEEAEISRRVAAALDLQWHFVPYSPARWAQWAARDDFREFRRGSTGLTAIEHEQDWPAILELRLAGVLRDDTVVIPGHAGDFLGGSHLPHTPATFESDAVDWIWQRYFVYEWPTTSLPTGLVTALRARIAEQVQDAATPAEAVSRYGWQERQSKMVANSVRVYEHHGLDWRLPFWSHPPALNFWGRVRLDLRRGARLYRRAIGELMEPAIDSLPVPVARRGPSAAWARLTDRDMGRYGMWMGPHPLARALRVRLRDLIQIGEPAVAEVVEAIVGPWKDLPPQRALINGLLALGQLNELADGRPLTDRD